MICSRCLVTIRGNERHFLFLASENAPDRQRAQRPPNDTEICRSGTAIRLPKKSTGPAKNTTHSAPGGTHVCCAPHSYRKFKKVLTFICVPQFFAKSIFAPAIYYIPVPSPVRLFEKRRAVFGVLLHSFVQAFLGPQS